MNRERFEMFDVTHLGALGVFVVGAVVLVLVGRGRRGIDGPDHVARGLALVLAVVAVPWQLIQFTPGEWDLQKSLPLHLCNIGWVIAFCALWTKNRTLSVITFLWGVTLSTQAMLTPDLATPFPDIRFWGFWVLHWVAVWAGIYLVWGLRIHLSWRTYGYTVAVTLGWMASVFSFNLIAGTNYGYLNEKPPLGSVLDYLPAWPYYLFVQIVLVASVWALIVAAFRPWRDRTEAHPPQP